MSVRSSSILQHNTAFVFFGSAAVLPITFRIVSTFSFLTLNAAVSLRTRHLWRNEVRVVELHELCCLCHFNHFTKSLSRSYFLQSLLCDIFPPKIYTQVFKMTEAKYCFNHTKIRKDSGLYLHPFFIVCAILIICFLLPWDILILSHSNETAYFYGILSVWKIFYFTINPIFFFFQLFGFTNRTVPMHQPLQ